MKRDVWTNGKIRLITYTTEIGVFIYQDYEGEELIVDYYESDSGLRERLDYDFRGM